MLVIKYAVFKGFSLIELLIAMAVGAISMSILLTALSTQLAASAKSLIQRRLAAEVDAVVDLIVREVARSGAQHIAAQKSIVAFTTRSPFARQMQVSSHPQELPDSCIVFAYDSNKNGLLDGKNPNEYRGFRLRNGSIEMRQAQADCASSGWQDLTDQDVTVVEELTFQHRPQKINGISYYQIQINVFARSKNHSEYTQRRQHLVAVYNHDL